MSNTAKMVGNVGNSWIICRSKSYAGRIYYFNTLTGEAAWNLSRIEIEKAKTRTSILQKQRGFQIDNCPEPIDSPQDQSNQFPSYSNQPEIVPRNIIPPKLYNNEFTTKLHPKSPYIGQFPAFNATNPEQLNIPITTSPNHGKSNVTPHPIFVTSISKNQQTVINSHMKSYDHMPVTHTAVPLSNRFKNQDKSYVQSLLLQKEAPFVSNNTSSGKNSLGKRFDNLRNDLDLRHILSIKRKSNIGNHEFHEGENFQNRNLDIKTSNNQSTDRKTPYNLCSWEDYDDQDILLGENLDSQSFKESVDISHLKKLLDIENNMQVWYIVLDSNVLLNNITFLKILLNSDNQCRLIIPQIVMDKIQMATNSRLRTQAHTAAYFVLQLVDSKVAVIDKGYNQNNNDDKDILVNCCLRFTEQGYKVMILTDDIELHSFKDNKRFLIFTVRKLKKLLSHTTQEGLSNNLEDLTLNESRNIKITIPNYLEKSDFDMEGNKQESMIIYHSEACFDKNNICEDSVSENSIVEEHMKANNSLKNTDTPHREGNKTCNLFSTNINQEISYEATEVTLNQNDLNSKRKLCSSIPSSFSKLSDIEHTEVGNIIEENQLCNAKNIPEHISYASSVASLYNNEDINEVSKVPQEKSRDNFIIKELSTCETLSKTVNMNVENNQAVYNKNYLVKEKHCKDIINSDNKNVMFEVTSSTMEDTLKNKCDEWVSRFVQIMEEASTQVLQQDPPFILDTMPPPWTIYEATECTKRKFYNDSDTVDAANKLINVLFEIGGLRGKIKVDISPHKYMEMYSYGVYLIDALQSLLVSNEDLQTAGESLSKLLNDIQDSHLHPVCQDSLTDAFESNTRITDEKTNVENESTSTLLGDNLESANHTESPNIQQISKNNIKNSKCETNILSPRSYNLRSHKKKLLKQKEEFSEKVNFIRNIDLESSFFTSLHLKKKIDMNIKDISTEVNTLYEDNINNKYHDNFLIGNTESVSENVNNTNVNKDITEPEKCNITNEPKVIRNFTKCVEFENKLKNKLGEQNLIYDSWTYNNEGYRDKMECEDSEPLDYTSTENEYYYDDDDEYEMFDTEDMCEVNPLDGILKSVENNKTVVKFNDIFRNIEMNIREVFLSVHRFCVNCYTTLRSHGVNFEKKNMEYLAEETHSYLNNVCDALKGILNRETSDSAYKIQELLKIKHLQEFLVEDPDLDGYRTFIRKCLEQGYELRDSVQLVIDACRE